MQKEYHDDTTYNTKILYDALYDKLSYILQIHTSQIVPTISVDLYIAILTQTDGLCPFVPMHGPTFCIVGIAGGQAQALVPELPRLAGGQEQEKGKDGHSWERIG